MKIKFKKDMFVMMVMITSILVVLLFVAGCPPQPPTPPPGIPTGFCYVGSSNCSGRPIDPAKVTKDDCCSANDEMGPLSWCSSKELLSGKCASGMCSAC